jgi:hypothetical protein
VSIRTNAGNNGAVDSGAGCCDVAEHLVVGWVDVIAQSKQKPGTGTVSESGSPYPGRHAWLAESDKKEGETISGACPNF